MAKLRFTIVTGPAPRRLQNGKNLELAVLSVTAAIAVLTAVLAHPLRLTAQAPPRAPAPLQFEVASLKVASNQDILESRPKRTTGRFRWTTQMYYLLGYAFHMELWRISGKNAPLDTIYEIDATTDPKAGEDQVRLMLRSLLITRFQLKVHRDTKSADGYSLNVAKGGPRMEEAKDGEVPALPEWMRGSSTDPASLEGLVVATIPARGVCAVTGRRATMLQLTETLQRLVHTTVLDQTGLSGAYYFALQYAIDDQIEVPYPNLIGALRALGLRLERYQGPVEMLVVDHMEQVPTQN